MTIAYEIVIEVPTSKDADEVQQEVKDKLGYRAIKRMVTKK